MISHQEIENLITEIDRALETEPELSVQVVLEKVRWYLRSQQNEIEVTPLASDSLPPDSQETAQAIAQAVMAQLNLQREDWMQPNLQEIEQLRQQKELLWKEIRQLEGQRSHLISDFIQVLLGRCSEELKHELAKTFEEFEQQLWLRNGLGKGKGVEASQSPLGSPLKELERLEQLRSLHEQGDHLLMSLDRTFRSVFNTLERDLQSHQYSLTQGLERMQELGQQGETVFQTLVTRYLEQVHQNPIPLEIDNPPEKETVFADYSTPHQAEQTQQVQDPSVYPFAGLELDKAAADSSSDPVDLLFELDLHNEPVSQPMETQGDAWEEWDESLFNSDQWMRTWEDQEHPPVVLTGVEEKLTPVEEETSSVTSETELEEETSSVTSETELEEQTSSVTSETELEEQTPNKSLENQLFGGLTDPAFSDTPSQDPPQETAPNPSTVEAALFSEPILQPPNVPPETILDNPPPTNTEQPSLEDTISSLTELLEQAADAPELFTHEDQDEYAAVTPGETLLATDELQNVVQQEDIESILNAQKLQQLTADLEKFETGESPTPVGEESPEDDTDSAPIPPLKPEEPPEPIKIVADEDEVSEIVPLVPPDEPTEDLPDQSVIGSLTDLLWEDDTDETEVFFTVPENLPNSSPSESLPTPPSPVKEEETSGETWEDIPQELTSEAETLANLNLEEESEDWDTPDWQEISMIPEDEPDPGEPLEDFWTSSDPSSNQPISLQYSKFEVPPQHRQRKNSPDLQSVTEITTDPWGDTPKASGKKVEKAKVYRSPKKRD